MNMHENTSRLQEILRDLGPKQKHHKGTYMLVNFSIVGRDTTKMDLVTLVEKE